MQTGTTHARLAMPGREATEAEIQNILEMNRNGLTGSKIASLVGRSNSFVCRTIRDAENLLTELGSESAINDEIRTLYRRGYSIGYLSKLRKFDSRKTAQIVQDIDPPSRHATGLDRLIDLQKNVEEDYLSNRVGSRDIAKRYGVQERTVIAFLQMKGYQKKRGAQSGEENPQTKKPSNQDTKYWAKKVVETMLGQKLPAGFVVHHMNENPGDQTASNLWLFSDNLYHLRYHQRQLANLQQGGLLVANRLAKECGGLWLPQTICRLQELPGTTLSDLLDTLVSPTADLPELEPGMA
jgi:IS30 family transposase